VTVGISRLPGRRQTIADLHGAVPQCSEQGETGGFVRMAGNRDGAMYGASLSRQGNCEAKEVIVNFNVVDA
jgi:hypothetical protein